MHVPMTQVIICCFKIVLLHFLLENVLVQFLILLVRSYLAESLSAGSWFEIVLFHFLLAGSLSAGSWFEIVFFHFLLENVLVHFWSMFLRTLLAFCL